VKQLNQITIVLFVLSVTLCGTVVWLLLRQRAAPWEMAHAAFARAALTSAAGLRDDTTPAARHAHPSAADDMMWLTADFAVQLLYVVHMAVYALLGATTGRALLGSRASPPRAEAAGGGGGASSDPSWRRRGDLVGALAVALVTVVVSLPVVVHAVHTAPEMLWLYLGPLAVTAVVVYAFRSQDDVEMHLQALRKARYRHKAA